MSRFEYESSRGLILPREWHVEGPPKRLAQPEMFGPAFYSGAAPAPAPAPAPPATVGTILALLPFNGGNHTGYAPDLSINRQATEIIGNGEISTAQSKWAGSSLSCPSSINYPSAKIPNHSRFNSAKTWQGWFRFSASSFDRTIFTTRLTNASYAPIELTFTGNGASPYLSLLMGNSGLTAWAVNIGCSDLVIVPDTWVFLRVWINGTTVRVQKDSTVSATTGTLSSGLATTTNPIYIGGIPDTGTPAQMFGYVNDFLITDGIETGVPTAAITPPVSAPAAPAGAGSHRYWCVNMTTVQFNSVTEVEFRQTFTGLRTISQTNTGGTASSTNNYTGLPAAGAFDGSFLGGNRYASNALASRLIYDFGSAVNILEVAFGATFGTSQNPATFNIEFSDDALTWYPVSQRALAQNEWSNDGFRVFRVDAPPVPTIASANVVAYLQMDGSGASFADSGPNGLTVTAAGSATQTTTAGMFGGGKALVCGANSTDYIGIAANALFNLTSFTVNFRVLAASWPSSLAMVDIGGYATGLSIRFNHTGTSLSVFQNSGSEVDGAFTWVPATMYEIEVSFDSPTATLRLFVGGTLIQTATSAAFPFSTPGVRIGVPLTGGATNGIARSFDDVLIANTVLHTASYLPRTAAYTIV